MNDCIFSFIPICEDDSHCINCPYHISANEARGEELLSQYQQEIDTAIEPVIVKWKSAFSGGEIV